MIKAVSFVSEREAIELAPRTDTAMISITDTGRIAKVKEGWGALSASEFSGYHLR